MTWKDEATWVAQKVYCAAQRVRSRRDVLRSANFCPDQMIKPRRSMEDGGWYIRECLLSSLVGGRWGKVGMVSVWDAVLQ